MNIRLRILFFTVCLTFLCQILFGQISLCLPTLADVQSGEMVEVPLIIPSGFDSVESIQFVVRWDSTVLRFLSTSSYGINGLDGADFGYNTAQANLLRLAYTAPNLNGQGVTAAPNTILFKIKFLVVGPTNSGSPLSITEEPPTTYFEILRSGGQIFTLSNTTIKNGFAPIGYNVSVIEPFGLTESKIEVYPNPANHFVYLKSNHFGTVQAKLSLCSADGLILHTFVAELTKDSPFKLNLDAFNRNTLVYLLIQTDQWSERTPIVFTRE